MTYSQYFFINLGGGGYTEKCNSYLSQLRIGWLARCIIYAMQFKRHYVLMIDLGHHVSIERAAIYIRCNKSQLHVPSSTQKHEL